MVDSFGGSQRFLGALPIPRRVTAAVIECLQTGVLVDLLPEKGLIIRRKPVRRFEQKLLSVIEATLHDVHRIR